MKTLSGRVVLAAIVLSCGFAIHIGSGGRDEGRNMKWSDGTPRPKAFHPDGTPCAPKEVYLGTIGSVSYLQSSTRK